MEVTAGIFLASILLKEMRYLVYIRYLWFKPSSQDLKTGVRFGDRENLYVARSLIQNNEPLKA
jgi:hypothetical protein